MHKICSAVIVVLLIFSFKSQAQQENIIEIESQLKALASDEMQGRETGTEGIEKASKYISGFFKKENIKPYYESYIDTFYLKDKKPAYNVIAYIEGTESYLNQNPVIIGAHYDHIGIRKAIDGDSIANGANDNASGTVGVMQLAKRLKESKPKRPIIFVLFDAEEKGLLGSTYLAEKLKSEDVIPYVVINLEMIGVPMNGKPGQAYITGYKKSNFVEYFNEYANQEVLIFSSASKQYQLFKRSDNWPFYKSFEIPAHSFSTFDFSNYEYYHHVDDEAALMNPEHMNTLIDSWVEPISKIANHSDNTIKMTNE
jgi:Zn-dependent M28 family amino/carboxypeptidase